MTLRGLFCGAKRDRTADLLNAIQALSQLSYSPENARLSGWGRKRVAYYRFFGAIATAFDARDVFS